MQTEMKALVIRAAQTGGSQDYKLLKDLLLTSGQKSAGVTWESRS